MNRTHLYTWHVYARYFNFGDHALGVGIRNIFSRSKEYDWIFKLYDTYSVQFDEHLIAELNGRTDLLLVGGGGLLHRYRVEDQWLFQMPTHLVPQLAVPMIFYGLGHNTFPGEPEISSVAIANIRTLQEKAISFSVRNDGSKERLEKLGIVAPEVPDPGFFVDGDYPAPDVPRPFVIIQLANDKPEYRQFDEGALLGGCQNVARFLLKKGYCVVLAPHTRADIALSARLLHSLQHPDVRMWDFYDMLRDEHTLRGLAYYKHASFVIAMRGHAQICPMGMGTPVISIANHQKHRGILEHVDVPCLAVEAMSPAFSEVLLDLVKEVENHRSSIIQAYKAATAKMRETTREFINEMIPRFEAARRPIEADR